VQQVVHFDTTAQRPLQAWIRGLNALLPKTMSVTWAVPVGDDFHARHSAIERRYTYALFNRPVRPSLLVGQVGWLHRPAQLLPMQLAAQTLIGEHDFSSFRASECQARSPIRTITQFEITQADSSPELFLFHVQANAFLHHMIRNVVGSLVYVGMGKWSLDDFAQAFAAKDRQQGAPTFAPDGLYFCGATYPERFGIPAPKPFNCLAF
jgi:tRNA pseudouridine38-40 synthase